MLDDNAEIVHPELQCDFKYMHLIDLVLWGEGS